MLSLIVKDSNSGSNSGKKKGRFYYGWIVLASCLILVTISYGIRFSFGVFFKSLEQEFSWTRAMTSGVFSIYMLFGALCAIAGGWAVDRYGAKIVFLIMAFFAFLGLSLTGRVNEPWHLFVSYSLLVAMGTGPTYVIVNALASRWFTKRRGLASAIVTSGVGLGTILMAPIADYLISGYGWRFSYFIMGVISLIIMIPCALSLKRAPSETTGEKPEAIKLNSSDGQNPPRPREFSALQAAKTRNFWLFISIWFLYSICLFTITTHIVRHALDLGIASMAAASIISISGFANIPSRLLMGIASDRFGRRRIAVICCLLMAASMLWVSQSSSLWMLYLFAVAFGAAYGGLAPPVVAIVGDVFGLRHIGAIFGMLEIGWVSGGAVGPALAGYIFDTTRSYDLAFLLTMVAALIMAVLFLLLRLPVAQTGDKLSGN